MSRTQDESKRQAIMEAAFRVFGRHGYGGTTIKHIADEAGIAAGSIYTYFRDKDDLFRTAVEEGWRDFLSAFNDLAVSDFPMERRVVELVEMGMRKLREAMPLLRGMLFEATQMPAFGENVAKFSSYVAQLLEEGRARGLLCLAADGSWRSLVKVLVNGAMFSIATTPESEVEREIAAVKESLLGLVRERIREERPSCG